MSIIKSGLITLLFFSNISCMSSTGDFGRHEGGVISDTVLPMVGKITARTRGEPTSKLHQTNEEKAFSIASHQLISPPHSNDWYGDLATQMQESRIIHAIDNKRDHQRYYTFLMSKHYQSSHVRYDRLMSDMRRDIGYIDGYIAKAQNIVELDKERLRMMRIRNDLSPITLQGGYARIEENRKRMQWVWRAVQYRQKSYDYALKELSTLTPSTKSAQSILVLKSLKHKIESMDSVFPLSS